MSDQTQQKQVETLFLRFSGEALSLSEWVENQTKERGFRNRQDFVLNILREAKQQAEQFAQIAA